MTETFKREMTITHRDFFRILPKALKSYLYQQHENVINVILDGGEIVIILAEERLRQIAALSLPLTTVTFQINNVAEITKNEFFKQFDRAYHRGGG
jgi:phosphatidylinositol kinase/protein kinase (PI-3  family)